MRILVIDAQGGGLGKELITKLRARHKDLDITCVGTNSLATSAMLKAGENPVVVNAAKADIILGPIGIMLTNSLYGEITEKISQAISLSPAIKILIPFRHDDNIIVGISDYSIKKLVDLAMIEVEKNL